MSDISKQLRGSGGCERGCQCLLCEAADEMDRLRAEVEPLKVSNMTLRTKLEQCRAELSKARQAIGLLTTLAPSMEIDVNDPIGMAQEIVRVVSEKDKLIEELEGDLFTVLDDNTELSNDHKPHDFEPPDDLEPVYATLHFYYNDPDSMRRMRECLDAPKWKSAVQEFDRWMRNRIKYNPDSETDPLYISEEGIVWLEIAREQLNMRLEDYGINIWDD